MKNYLKKSLQKILWIWVLALGVIPAAHAQSNMTYDVCDPPQARQFILATGGVRFNSFSPRTALAGQTVTITGEDFNTLPATGTLVLFLGVDFSGNTKLAWVPVNILSDTQLQVQIPNSSNSVQLPAGGSGDWELRDNGRLDPGIFTVTTVALTYIPEYPSLGGCGEDIRSVGWVWGTQATGNPFPSPSRLAAVAKSDSTIQLSWNYDLRHPHEEFRVYMHWCKKTPFDDCSSRNPYDYDLNESYHLNGQQVPFWKELTDVNSPNAADRVPRDATSVPISADLTGDPASFADSVLHFAMTAHSRGQGESRQPPIASVTTPDSFGCYGRIQRPRAAGNYQVTIRHVPGNDPVNRQPKRSPFPGQINPSVQFSGVAQASYDSNQYPVVDFYGELPPPGTTLAPPGTFPEGNFPLPEILPFHHDPVTFGDPNNPRMALQMSRGYGTAGNGSVHANIVIDGRFENVDPNTGLREGFYAATHLFLNHHDLPDFNPALQDNTVFVIALVAGQAIGNQPDTIGMVALRPSGNITNLQIPTVNASGSISGSIRAPVYYLQTATPELPGSLDDGSGQPDTNRLGNLIHWWESDVEIQFNNLPLHSDECA